MEKNNVIRFTMTLLIVLLMVAVGFTIFSTDIANMDERGEKDVRIDNMNAEDQSGDGTRADNEVYFATIDNNGYIYRSEIKGDGTFGSVQRVARPYSNSGWGVGVADFDNDGDLDIVAQYSSSGRLYYIKKTAAGNSFASPVQMFTGQYPYTDRDQLVVADFNNDGNMDFVCLYYYGYSSYNNIYLGKGDGTFTKRNLGSMYSGTTWYNYGTTAADFNEDGNMDIMMAYSNQFIMFRGKGDGTFHQASRVFSYGSYSNYYIASGDFNGDDHFDLVFADYRNGNMYRSYGNGNGGFGGVSYTSCDVSPYTYGYTTGDAFDFDSDGKQDIMALNRDYYGELYWYKGSGSGTFSPSSPSGAYYLGDFGYYVRAVSSPAMGDGGGGESEYGGGVFPEVTEKFYPPSTSWATGAIRYYTRYGRYYWDYSDNFMVGRSSSYYYYRGWATFDVSKIPEAANINKITLGHYRYSASGYWNSYYYIYDLTTEPISSPKNYYEDGQRMYNDISGGNAYVSNRYSSSSGWHQWDLSSQARTDLKNRLSSKWFGVGFYKTGSYDYSYQWIYGWSQSTYRPYIEVTYKVPDAPKYYKEPFSNPLIGEDANSFGVAWSKYSSDENSARNEQVDTRKDDDIDDAFDDSRYCWVQSNDGGRGPNLNELTLRLGVIGTTSLKLQFATKAYGDDRSPDPMDDQSNDHDCLGDGIAVSKDGKKWYKAWQHTGTSTWQDYEINLMTVPNLNLRTSKDELHIRFQQYDDKAIPGAGILWDEVRVEANKEATYLFDPPTLTAEAANTEEVIFATDQGGEDGIETTELSLKLTGLGGNEPSTDDSMRYTISSDTECGDTATRYSSSRNVIYDSEGNLYCAYIKRRPGSGPYNTWVAKSEDGGKTWTEKHVSTGNPYNSFQNNYCYNPTIAIDGQDNIHVSWYCYRSDYPYGDRVWYSRSSDKGSSWSSAVQIYEPSYNRHARYPSIAVDSDDNVYIAFEYYDPYSYPYYSIRLARKTPQGSWNSNEVMKSYYLYRPSIAIDDEDKIYIAFRDDNYRYMRIYHSTNAHSGGNTWSNSYYYHSGYTLYDPCIAVDYNNGYVYVVFYDQYGSDGINIIRSTNGGSGWVSAWAAYGSGNMRFPSVSVDASGKIYVAYRNNGQNAYDIFITECSNWPTFGEPVGISDPAHDHEYYPSLLWQGGYALKEGWAVVWSAYPNPYSCMFAMSRRHPEFKCDSDAMAGEEVEIKLELTEGLEIVDVTETDGYDSVESEPDNNIFVWKPEDLPPGSEWELVLSIFSDSAFEGRIGSFYHRHIDWKGDPIPSPVGTWEKMDEEFDLIVRATGTVLLEMEAMGPIPDGFRERIVSNNPDGTLLTAHAWDQFGYDPGSPDDNKMPPQSFDWSDTFDDVSEATMTKFGDENTPPEVDDVNMAHIIALVDTVGVLGTINATLVAPDTNSWDFPVGITYGPPAVADVDMEDEYVINKDGLITAGIYDAFENAVFDWAGRMYVEVLEDQDPPLEWKDLETETDPGTGYAGYLYYEFSPSDGGTNTFIIKPQTWKGDGTTTIRFLTVEGLSTQVSINVVAGAVETLTVVLDYDRIRDEVPGWDYIYRAGMPLYFEVTGHDEDGNPSSNFNLPLVLTYDAPGSGDYEPEPWQTEEGDIVFNTDVWSSETRVFPAQSVDIMVGRNPDGMPLKFFKTGQATVTFQCKVNLALKGTADPIIVNPADLNYVTCTPYGTEKDPVIVYVGGVQKFGLDYFDEYDNVIDPSQISREVWTADSNINIQGIGTAMDVPGLFEAIEYFHGARKQGDVSVDVRDSLGGSATESVSVLVINTHDVWIDIDEIEPTHVLIGEEMVLSLPIHYDIPVDALGIDYMEVNLKYSLVDAAGIPIKDEHGNDILLYSGTYQLLDLRLKPSGVQIFTETIPAESFSGYIHYVRENDQTPTPNYIKVSVEDVLGGARMDEFEITSDNNEVTIQFFGVIPRPAESPSFAPAVFLMGLALLGLAIVSTIYSGRKRKGGKRCRKDKDAVSPVIAIILMVAITIVLAGVLWLWVSGLVATGKDEPLYKGFQTEWAERTRHGDYVLLIKQVDGKNALSVEDLRFTLYGSDQSDMSGGQHKVSNVYGKPIDDQTLISFRDGDHDGMLSVGDRFIIKSAEHVNDDGTPSPGYALPGFTFELRAQNSQVIEKDIV